MSCKVHANEVAQKIHPASIASPLDVSARSLESTLLVLAQRLTLLSSGPTVDPGTIASVADAICRVTQALAQVKELQSRS
jgi:hypothetical protein